MKNENGSGSVYKLSGKRRKPWAAAVTIGYSVDGKQVRKLVGTFEKKREAQEALLEYIGNPAMFSNKTFGDIRKLWWENYLKQGLSKNTVKNNVIRVEQLSGLDHILIKDIKLHHMQKIFDDMEISYNYKKVCKSLLNMIFEFASKNEYVKDNKVRHIVLGENTTVVPRFIFAKDELKVLWSNTASQYAVYILILIYTGMRISELLSLKISDIDHERRALNIKASKTKSGVRIIPLSAKIYNLIVENMDEDQLLFIPGKKGKMNYGVFEGGFKRILRDLNLPSHTIHDTRHTFASLLSNADANQASIAKLIGHSNYSITESVYTHKDTEELRKAMELII